MFSKQNTLLIICSFFSVLSWAQGINNNPFANHANKFEQLDNFFPAPNVYRAASGAPGSQYWQQRVDYKIVARLDDEKQRLNGDEIITYYNNSKDTLAYLWIQLDENQNKPSSEGITANGSTVKENYTAQKVKQLFEKQPTLGINIVKVMDGDGQMLPITINGTMMRIDLPKSLLPKAVFKFSISWWYNLANRMKVTDSRGGYEYFPIDKNYLYTITQWFPRLAVYNDYQGWNNKQFLGTGEFALNFGNYEVSIDVPADHVVNGTGECINYKEVLSANQFKRYEIAKKASEPVEIITIAEANKNAFGSKSKDRKIWQFKAQNVRDFAWVSSRRLAWDGMNVSIDGGRDVMVMSLYGKEAYGLFRRYSTKLVAQTLKTYSKYTIPYPYPVAISVEAFNEMEYPMISFNTGRTDENGKYTETERNYMNWILIHEVGHNFFPMIINSDERQWSFMDEGFNTFLQYLTEQEYDSQFPSGRGPAYKISAYMAQKKEKLEPILTNSENIDDYLNNQYGKTATALNILRETILGPQLFDHAFKTYATRWAFKHPTPYDFFRTIEDASATDLDWFWRGWFMGTDAVDIGLSAVNAYQIDSVAFKTIPISSGRPVSDHLDEYILKGRPKDDSSTLSLVERDISLQDEFYKARLVRSTQDKLQKKLATIETSGSPRFLYEVSFKNYGGLVMPILLKWVYEDGTFEIENISVNIWRLDEKTVTKTFPKNKKVKQLILDPYSETADIEMKNNVWIF